MSDSDEPITREKKPLSEARLAAIEKMKEGRKRALEEKKKLKEEEKEAKKQMKKQIKMKVEEEMNGMSSLPLEDEKVMAELKQKALEPVKVSEEPATAKRDAPDEEDTEEEVIEIKQPVKKPRGRPKKKKIVVNNYYEDDSSESEEEIVNNYHKKKRKSKKKPVKKVESSESETEEEIIEEEVEEVGLYETPQLVRQRSGYPYGGAMAGISFR